MSNWMVVLDYKLNFYSRLRVCALPVFEISATKHVFYWFFLWKIYDFKVKFGDREYIFDVINSLLWLKALAFSVSSHTDTCTSVWRRLEPWLTFNLATVGSNRVDTFQSRLAHGHTTHTLIYVWNIYLIKWYLVPCKFNWKWFTAQNFSFERAYVNQQKINTCTMHYECWSHKICSDVGRRYKARLLVWIRVCCTICRHIWHQTCQFT